MSAKHIEIDTSRNFCEKKDNIIEYMGIGIKKDLS